MNLKKNVALVLLAVVVIGAADWWTAEYMAGIVREKAGKSLQAILAGTTKAADNWLGERLADAEAIARSATFVNLVMEADKEAAAPPGSNPAAKAIEAYLGPQMMEHVYEGYLVINRDRKVLSSSWPDAGELARFLTERGDFIQNSLEGRHLASPTMAIPQAYLNQKRAPERTRDIYIFIASPIKDQDGKTLAVLAMAVDLSRGLAKITTLAGFERSGETYAVDRNGVMVTPSRFEAELREIGLLEPGQGSAGNIAVRDPGGDMTQGFKPDLPREKQALTLMASEGIKMRDGLNLAGYRDYRGVMVVGTWTWDAKLGLVLCTEIDQAEMYEVLDHIRTLFLSVLALTIMASGLLITIIWRNYLKTNALSVGLQKALDQKQREEEQRQEAERQLRRNQESLAMAQAVAHLGSWDWDPASGNVVCSDEMRRIFGLEKESGQIDFEAVMEMVHAEDRQRVRQALHAAFERGEEFDAEYRIVRPGGEIRWLASRGEVIRDDGGARQRMVGTALDITPRRLAQQELERYRDNLEQEVRERTASLTQANQRLEEEAEERKLAEERIRNNEARLKALIDTALEGVVTINEHGIVQTFNPAAEGVFGYQAEEVLGRNVNMLMPEPIKSRHDQFIKNYITRGPKFKQGLKREVVALHKSGRGIDLDLSVSSFLDAGRRMFTGMLHDIGERKKAEQELREAKIQAEEASQAKGRFLANMSHEIRTPMNAVIGYLDLAIEDPDMRERTKSHLETAARAAKNLLRLLNDILDVSKMEAGKMELEQIRFNARQLINDMEAMFKAKTDEKNLSLTLEVQPDLPQCFLGDPSRLRQVLVNLLSNAVKFTEKGGVSLSLRRSEDASELHFTVQDSGIGIAKDKIANVLEPFTQADVSTTRRFGGTGLGTTISRQIIEMMGGRIWIESELGKGSTFHFTVALPESECSATCTTDCENYQGDRPEAQKPKPGRAYRILLAEDVRENAELAIIRLEQQGHKVTHAWNGAEALAAIGNGEFDLVLMDVQMPVMDGLDASRRIREMESGSGRRMPIMALTASIMQEDKERCSEAGMDLVVGKPIDFPTLFAKLDKLVPEGKGAAISRVWQPLKPEDAKELPDLPGIDTAKGLRIWQDNAAYHKALRWFVESHSNAAREIAAAIEEGDAQKAYSQAHALKGVAGNLAISRVYELAKEIDGFLKKKQEGEALALTLNLATALAEAVKAISGMQEKAEKDETPLKELDRDEASGLFEKLQAALELDDPGAAEPLLERLAEYIPGGQLKPLRKTLDKFDFDGAKQAARELRDQILSI